MAGRVIQPAVPFKKKKSRSGLFITLLALLPAGMFMLFGFHGCTGSVEGEIRSAGKPHGDFVLKPTSCFSGEHESFFGVWVTPDLEKADGRQGFKGGLKIIKNELSQWKVYLESPIDCEGLKCVIRPLDEGQCKVFDVEVHNTNTTFNEIRVREGHATLECDTVEGGIVSAKLKFSGCS